MARDAVTVSRTVQPFATVNPTGVRAAALGSTIALFGLTIFTGAGLLFLVQPMFAKLALPRLGGSPAVWNTCVLFFQSMLLAGYLYAHFSTRWLGVRRQAILHLLVLLTPIAVLPLTLGDIRPPVMGNPAWWLLLTMTQTVGLPFFVVSTTAPLLQRWFATLPIPSARDPYFLYAASNLGSMLALGAYALVLEPTTGTRVQTWVWASGYVALAALTAACAMVVRAFANEAAGAPEPAPAVACESLSARRRLRWLVLSFVPSSLMLGVTTHISTDVAAVPLLWVLPLAMYLGTFVLAFSSREVLPHRWLVRGVPVLMIASLCTVGVTWNTWWLIPLHLVTFFVTAMVCHRELVRHRPAAQHLTEFYIWMSFGGMLGGVFNSLVAPQLFSSILEYPLVLALAALVRPSPRFRGLRPEPIGLLVGLPAFSFLLCVGLWATGATGAGVGIGAMLVAFVCVLTAISMLANRPGAFGVMSFVVVAVIALGRPSAAETVLFAGRSFFGVHRVVDAPDHSYHLLQHGSTAHGRQEMAAGICEPTGYYHTSNPIGQLFRTNAGRFTAVAVIGLGSGGLACYAETGDEWTFYEIDPLVERIARDSRYFTHLQNTDGNSKVVLGDGRLAIQQANPGTYDLIILDAFSSDAIPVHLLTQEAIELYLSRLRADGIVAVHISNRYLSLEPLLAALARQQGLFAIANIDGRIPETDASRGRFASHWVMLARTREPLASLEGRPGWRSPAMNDRVRPWTDDYSNILQVLALH